MPAEVVNQSRLEAEYAVHTASLALRVHRGGMPGAPVATGEVRILAMGTPLNSLDAQMVSDGSGVVAEAFSSGLRRNAQATPTLSAYSTSSGIARSYRAE